MNPGQASQKENLASFTPAPSRDVNQKRNERRRIHAFS